MTDLFLLCNFDCLQMYILGCSKVFFRKPNFFLNYNVTTFFYAIIIRFQNHILSKYRLLLKKCDSRYVFTKFQDTNRIFGNNEIWNVRRWKVEIFMCNLKKSEIDLTNKCGRRKDGKFQIIGLLVSVAC